MSSSSLSSPLLSTTELIDRCVFPSLVHQTNSYGIKTLGTIYECTLDSQGHYWCPLNENYASYRKWQFCPNTTQTYAGNDPGKVCYFPFIYNSKFQYTCLKKRSGNNMIFWWCSTTRSFDNDKLWTRCRETSDQLPCIFKQTKVSNADIDYKCSIISTDQSIHINIWRRQSSNLICRTEMNEIRYCPITERTFGGNNPGNPCHFPFYYQKKEYTSCIDINTNKNQSDRNYYGYKWCSTSDDFDRDQQWTYCYRGNIVLQLFSSLTNVILLSVGFVVIFVLVCLVKKIIKRYLMTRNRPRDYF